MRLLLNSAHCRLPQFVHSSLSIAGAIQVCFCGYQLTVSIGLLLVLMVLLMFMVMAAETLRETIFMLTGVIRGR